MIAIKFNPLHEDRANIFFKSLKHWDQLGIKYSYEEVPHSDDKNLCYWIIKYPDGKLVNIILNDLIELKHVMGVSELRFQYCHSMKEYYTQTVDLQGYMLYSNNWFSL